MSTETNCQHGGFRPGSGRKPKNPNELHIYKTVSIAGSPEEIEKLKESAFESGKSLSRYVLDKLLYEVKN